MAFLTSPDRSTDWILLNNLSLTTISGPSQWSNKPGSSLAPQPTLISVGIPFSIALAGGTDHLPHSIHYGNLAKLVQKTATQEKFGCTEHLAVAVAEAALKGFENEGMQDVYVVVEKPKALLHAKSAGARVVRGTNSRDGEDAQFDQILVKDLELTAVIGIHPWEREMKQKVTVNLTMDVARWDASSGSPSGFDCGALVNRVSEVRDPFLILSIGKMADVFLSKHALNSSYQTVEALVTSIAETALQPSDTTTPPCTAVQRITVSVSKPSALMFADSPEIIITRIPSDFALTSASTPADKKEGPETAVAAIAFGSNVGDRFVNIERALRMLEVHPEVKVLETSFLYEGTAMYVEDQRDFVNGAALISTSLKPLDLLALLKNVEMEVGRTPTFRWGPRVVDLDLIFYNELLYSSEEVDEARGVKKLVVPHERLKEATADCDSKSMIPQFVHPSMNLSVEALLRRVTNGGRETSLRKVVPFIRSKSLSTSDGRKEEEETPYWVWGERTKIMAVINTTPDSFSDGGDHAALNDAMRFVDSFIISTTSASTASSASTPTTAQQSMVDVIDIGGHSTRPGSKEISPEEETDRVIPVIEAVRSSSNAITSRTLISVDTYRGSVAKAALEAGADLVNDVYALTREGNDDILNVIKEAGCPVVMMHSRGDAGEDKDYDELGGVIEGIRVELGKKVQRALDAGVRRWNVIVDPGIGFSKTVEGNLTIVRKLGDITSPSLSPSIKPTPTRSLGSSVHSVHPLANMPVLVGSSRKSYLGK
ncbi:trifunctional dihydropteroate synthetase, partial [Tulasnella sp. 408]